MANDAKSLERTDDGRGTQRAQRCARAVAVVSAPIWLGSVDVGCVPHGSRWAMEPRTVWTTSSRLI